MTENPEPGAAAAETADSETTETPNTDANMVPLDSEHADSVPAREAAKWRGRLREVEAERDSLAGKVEALQRAQVDAHITALGTKPAAVWASALNCLISSVRTAPPIRRRSRLRSRWPANSSASMTGRSDPLED